MLFGGRSMRRGGGGRSISSSSSPTTSVRKAKTTYSGIGVYGPHDPPPPSSTLTPKRKSSTPLSLSSSSSQYQNNNIPIWNPFFTHTTTTTTDDDDSDWVSVDDYDDDVDADSSSSGFSGRFIGSPPSQIEVDYAVSSLQRVLGPASRIQLSRDNELDHDGQVSKDDPETDWVEPSMSPYNSMILQANGFDRVYYAIQLLQTDTSVQRLVKSLSTDEAVWDAVLNNDVVQELRELISSDREQVIRSLDKIAKNDPHEATNVLMWILNTASAKFMVVIDKITQFVINLFRLAFNKTASPTEDSGPFNEKLRTSFMLSIIVLLIVVLSRVCR